MLDFFAEREVLSASSADPLEAVVPELPAFEPLEPESLGLVLPEPVLSDDPPPQPASASVAMASARETLALAVLADFVIERSRTSLRNA